MSIKIGDVEIATIRSGRGDCIHIRHERFNVIVDSGPTASAREFRMLCENIKARGEQLDTLIISHYDEDHIGGILKTGDLGFKSIYFNAYDGRTENGNLSAIQCQRLFHILPQTVVHSSVLKGDVINVQFAEITVYWPTKEALSKSMEKLKRADFQLKLVTDWNYSLDELMDKTYPDADVSVSNGASIIFKFEYNGTSILFTGDALADNIPKGQFDLVKLPHHGSIRNISDDVIAGLEATSFLICADGTRHPNKQTIAKLLKSKGRIIIYSNYDWWTKGFLQSEDMKYIKDGSLTFVKL